MLPKLIINGADFTGLLARNGLVQKDIFRQSRTIVTLDGVEHRTQIQKRQLDVSLVKTRLERLLELTAVITQPSAVTYIDRRLGEVTGRACPVRTTWWTPAWTTWTGSPLP